MRFGTHLQPASINKPEQSDVLNFSHTCNYSTNSCDINTTWTPLNFDATFNFWASAATESGPSSQISTVCFVIFMTRPCWGQMQFSCVGRAHRGLHAAADNDLVLCNMASTRPFFSSSCEPWSFGLPQGRPLSLILRGSSFQKPVDLQYVPRMIAWGFKVEGHKLMITVFYCRIGLLWIFHKLPSTSLACSITFTPHFYSGNQFDLRLLHRM